MIFELCIIEVNHGNFAHVLPLKVEKNMQIWKLGDLNPCLLGKNLEDLANHFIK